MKTSIILNAEAQEVLVAYIEKWKAEEDVRIAEPRLERLRQRKKTQPTFLRRDLTLLGSRFTLAGLLASSAASAPQVAKVLGRRVGSVRRQARQLGLLFIETEPPQLAAALTLVGLVIFRVRSVPADHR